ncbi:exodeoxyribonuclease VII large subunit, partial [Patescibacteria group bacterium]|nr:exodeoxyribonuclease VII large subunit [Patescibacteria group bacterium]
MEEKILTVSDYLHLINDTLALIPNTEVVVIGEISDFRVSQGKWINFALKDEEEEAQISCFATTFQVQIPLEDGIKIKVKGQPKVYEKFGKFSLNVREIELAGEGSLAKAYALLKKKLEAEGLFSKERKREMPRFPERIGLITSSEAAAYGDFLRILNNRWSGIEIFHIPVHVQGKLAVGEILEAFEEFNALAEKPEVLVLTRGGGSLEDLHAFNDEAVARAVFKSSIPVIVGVGHERDESLCDFVADVRASTPSNAAEIIVPDREEILRELEAVHSRMGEVLLMRIQSIEHVVDKSLHILERFIDRQTHEIKMIVERFVYSFERFRLSLVQTRDHIERNEKNIERIFLSIFDEWKNRVTSISRILNSFHVENI